MILHLHPPGKEPFEGFIMRLDGLKSFKTNTVGDGSAAGGLTPEEETQQQQEQIGDFFTGPTVGETAPDGPQNGNPVNDYMFGEISGDVIADDGSGSSVAAWLTNFPPSLEEIVAGNENALNYLDLVLARYDKAKVDLVAIQQAIEAEKASGTASPARIEEINAQLALIGTALARCDKEIEKVGQQSAKMDNVYLDEMRFMKDINGDNWVGRPYASGSYYVKYDDDGKAVFYDPKTRRAIPTPFLDPDYECSLLKKGDGISMIPPEEAHSAGSKDPNVEGEPSDINLKLSADALTATGGGENDPNIFQSTLDFTIPEAVWVERDIDSAGQHPYKEDFRQGTGEPMMKMLGWTYDDTKGLHQDTATMDRSQYMQAHVDSVKVRSFESGYKDANGNPLYDTVIELYNGDCDGGTLIGRIRIEGFETDNSGIPAATNFLMADGSTSSNSYVAASSVSLSLNGDLRSSPVKIDAGAYKSTCRHGISGIEEMLQKQGVSRPGDGGDGDASFDYNIGAFSDTGGGNYVSPDPATYRDVYVSIKDTKTAVTDPLLGNATGIAIRGVRGDITGTAYNDFVITTGVNELNAYAQEHMPPNSKSIAKGDPFYSNSVKLQGGNDIWIGGRGDNYVKGATFAWVRESNSSDTNYIAMQTNVSDQTETDLKTRSKNPRNFAHSYGGTTYLINPEEISETELTGETSDQVKEDVRKATDDDYYDIRGEFKATNPDETSDFVMTPGDACGGLEFFESSEKTGMEEWFNELMKVPSPDEELAQLGEDELNGQKTILDDEMNSFFGTMFGEAQETVAEQEPVTDPGAIV